MRQEEGGGAIANPSVNFKNTIRSISTKKESMGR
jgi:hypothetical protein